MFSRPKARWDVYLSDHLLDILSLSKPHLSCKVQCKLGNWTWELQQPVNAQFSTFLGRNGKNGNRILLSM